MSELFLKGLRLFFEKTLPYDNFHIDADLAQLIFLITGILLLVMGSKIYTFCASLVVFWGTCIVVCTLIDGHAGRRATVTAFVLIGCLLAFAAFKWIKADAVILSAMAASGVTYVFGLPWWAILLIAIACGVAGGFFPRPAALISTATIGACLIYETGIRYVAIFVICGLLFQLIWYGILSERRLFIWKRFFAKRSNT